MLRIELKDMRFRAFIISFMLMWLPITSQAAFLVSSNINYQSANDDSAQQKSETSLNYIKLQLAASINKKDTFFLGWNINSWSKAIKYGTTSEDEYSILEMGPKFTWFTSDEYRFYFAFEYNPYSKGTRKITSTERTTDGSSMGFGVGYRLRITKAFSMGASLYQMTTTVDTDTVTTTITDRGDKITFMLPMLELSFNFR
jgi:hypothetical protein